MALRYDELVKDQLANPPQYDQQGMLVRRYTSPSVTPSPTTSPQGQVLGAFVDNQGNTTPPAPTDYNTPLPTEALPTFEQFTKQNSPAVDENAIREATRKNMQSQIDAIDSYYADLVRQEQDAGNARLDKVRALNINSGLGGSSFASSADLEQRGLNDKSVKAIENEKAMKMAEVNGKIDEIAKADIAARKAEAKGNADAYTAFLDKQRVAAKDQITQLATAGVNLDTLDQQRKAYLFKAAGIDPQMADLYYNSLKPKQKQIDYKFEKLADGQGLFYGTDPTTGELKQIKVDVPIPPGYDFSVAPDGTPIIFNKTTGEAQVADGFYQGQFAKPGTAKSDIVKINGQDYVVDQNGNYTVPNVPADTQKASQLKSDALSKAQALLEKVKAGNGTSAVGGSRFWGFGGLAARMPGTNAASFMNDYNNLKALLSLDNVKYLKGQGQVSDAERKLLEDAASRLNTNQGDAEFQKTLEDLITSLSGASTSSGSTGTSTYDPNDPRVKDLKTQFPDATDEEIKQALGFNGSATGSTSNAVGARTDRHNNPTAFTTDIAKAAGLKEGVDYTTGDPFSGGQYHTAKLLGDPIATTIKVIDRIGFYTSGGKPRWSYVSSIPGTKNWDQLSYQQKAGVIKQMYQHEGGTQLLNNFG